MFHICLNLTAECFRAMICQKLYDMEKGEVTAYLSLIFILLISFVGGIMEAASVQMAKNYRRSDMNRAIESVFAEYQKELLEEYAPYFQIPELSLVIF